MDTTDPAAFEHDGEPPPLDPDEIVAEAQASFSLADRLKGITHGNRKVLLFTDVEAVDTYSKLNTECQSLTDAMGRLDVKKAEQAERHEILLKAFGETEEKMFAAKTVMTDASIVVHLQAYPNAVVKLARREGRKLFTDKVTKSIPQDRQTDYAEFVDLYLLGASVAKVTDSQGKPLTTPTDRNELGKMLSDTLPPAQWERLYNNFADLVLADQIGQAATNEAGF